MPFLWKKKSRVARISQRFVADLQSPRKHGGSLVVETGFPTSLVDLVVKNKNRLKKPSSKRKQDRDQDDCWEISDPVLTSPLPPHLVCPEACADLVEFESRGSGSSDGGIEVVAEEEEVRETEAIDVAQSGEDGGSVRNNVVVNVLRVFVVLVLGLSSRRFAAGITMSAVLLLLLELVGKWAVGSVVPCSDVRARFEHLIDRARDFFRILRFRGQQCKEGKSLDAAEDGGVSLKGKTVVERDVDSGETDGAVHAGEESIIRADPDSIERERRVDSLDSWIKMRYPGLKTDECLDSVSECEGHRHDQNAKAKSKFMQRIMPKRLKHPKAGKRNTVSTAAPSEAGQTVEDNYGKVEDEVQVPVAKEQVGRWSGDRKRTDEKMMNSDDDDEMTIDNVVVVKPVGGGRERKQRMALMITFTMILAALIGGRFLAVVLTTGYFGSKFIGAVMT